MQALGVGRGLAELILHGEHTTLDLRRMGYQRVLDNRPTRRREFGDGSQLMDTEFDYIVIGAGSAGCIVAARLTEDPSVKVLLVEAGASDRSLFIAMPGALAKREGQRVRVYDPPSGRAW